MTQKAGVTSAETELAEELAQKVEAAEERDRLVRKKEIYDHVTVATGLRKREVREAVDATFAYLHECLSEGRDLQIPPLGKLRVIEKGSGDNRKTQYRLNLHKAKHAAGDGDAAAGQPSGEAGA